MFAFHWAGCKGNTEYGEMFSIDILAVTFLVVPTSYHFEGKIQGSWFGRWFYIE